MAANDESKEAPSNECDYLVVGAGAAGMAFVDTLLTEDPTCRVVLVDRRAKAGGHWVDSYPFVRLHQPSHYYGVNSLPLGKARDAKGRASGAAWELASSGCWTRGKGGLAAPLPHSVWASQARLTGPFAIGPRAPFPQAVR